MRCCLTAAGTEVAAVAMWCRGGRCCGANGAARCRAVWCSGSGVDTGRSGIATTDYGLGRQPWSVLQLHHALVSKSDLAHVHLRQLWRASQSPHLNWHWQHAGS